MIRFAVTLEFYSRKQCLYNAGHTDIQFPVNRVCGSHTLGNVQCVKLNSSTYTALRKIPAHVRKFCVE